MPKTQLQTVQDRANEIMNNEQGITNGEMGKRIKSILYFSDRIQERDKARGVAKAKAKAEAKERLTT